MLYIGQVDVSDIHIAVVLAAFLDADGNTVTLVACFAHLGLRALRKKGPLRGQSAQIREHHSLLRERENRRGQQKDRQQKDTCLIH